MVQMVVFHAFRLEGKSSSSLGRVDVHFKRITVAAREMNALKLASVLQQRIAIPLYCLSFPKEFSIRCLASECAAIAEKEVPPFIGVPIEVSRKPAVGFWRNDRFDPGICQRVP